MGDKIKYKEGYKYQLQEDYSIVVDIKPDDDIDLGFVALDKIGKLIIRKGYAWDGASGPTIDTPNSMRGALVHDAGYQLIREGNLDKKYRKTFDGLLYNICMEDGMSRTRAWYWYTAVRCFASYAASPRNIRKIIIAP